MCSHLWKSMDWYSVSSELELLLTLLIWLTAWMVRLHFWTPKACLRCELEAVWGKPKELDTNAIVVSRMALTKAVTCIVCSSLIIIFCWVFHTLVYDDVCAVSKLLFELGDQVGLATKVRWLLDDQSPACTDSLTAANEKYAAELVGKRQVSSSPRQRDPAG